MGIARKVLAPIRNTAYDVISLGRQQLGLPHNKTRQQFRAAKNASKADRNEKRVTLIAAAAGLSEATVQQYVDEVDPEEYLARIENITFHIGSPTGLADGKTFHALVRSFPPCVAVDTGVALGLTSTIILQEIGRQGEGMLHSIDIVSSAAEHYGEVIPTELRRYWKLHLQDSEPILPTLLEELGEIDFFLHDSLHTYWHMQWEYETAWRYLRSGGCLASHDVLLTTAFETFRKIYQNEITASGAIGNVGFCIKR